MTNTDPRDLRGADAWRLHHKLVFDRPWPDGTVLSATTITAHGMSTLGFAPADDPEAYWSLVARSVADNESVYVSVGGLRPDVISSRGRGRKADVVAIPALIADLDIADGKHSADRLPTAAEVQGWLDELPLKPTLVTHTGGGSHIWVSLDDNLDPTRAEHLAIIDGWKNHWKRVAERDDRTIDLGVIADVARILRPAGSVNSKYDGRHVDVAEAFGARYSIERAAAAFTTSAAEVEHAREVVVLPPSKTQSGDQRVGTRFARDVPVSFLISEVWGARLDASGRVTFPNGAIYDAEPNAHIYVDSAIETLTVFGARVQQELGLDSSNHRLSSWDVWSTILCRGNFALAARVLAGILAEGAFTPRIFDIARDLARGETDLEALSDAFPARATMNLREAVENRGPARIDLEDGLFLRIGTGTAHGLFHHQRDTDGNSAPRRITSWIGWHRKVTTIMSADANGAEFEVAPARYEVQLMDARGRTRSRADLSVDQATEPRQVLNRIDLGLALPTQSGDRARVETMLRTAGRVDATEEVRRYATLGWMRDPDSGKHVYLAPAGSVTAGGVTHHLTVGAPAGSDEGALNAAAADLGFPSVIVNEAEAREAAGAIAAFSGIVPGRADAAYALIGLLFASPLALSRRTTIALIAPPSVGKSLLMNALQAFISGVTNASEFTGGTVGKGTTLNGAMAKISWLRHSLGCWDDFKAETNRSDNQRIASVMSALLQSTYGSDGAQKSTRDGGLRGQHAVNTTSVFTGEGTPSGEGLVSRLIHIPLHVGDVRNDPRGSSPYDAFMRDWAPQARRLFGGYLAWLAARIDALGALRDFTRENDQQRTEWAAGGSGRSSETVSMVAIGWRRLREFAEDFGFSDVLPRDTEVDAQLEKLVHQNREQTAQSNPALIILGRIRDLLASGEGHIVTFNGAQPRDPGPLGWRNNTFADWVPTGATLGVMTADEKVVVITNAAILNVRRALDLQDVPDDQIQRGALAFVLAGTTPGGRVSESLLPKRNRGWAVPARLLDLGPKDTEAALEELTSNTDDSAEDTIALG